MVLSRANRKVELRIASTTIIHLTPVIFRGGTSSTVSTCCFSLSRLIVDVFSETSWVCFFGTERSLALIGAGASSFEVILSGVSAIVMA